MTDNPHTLEALAARMRSARDRLIELADEGNPFDRPRLLGKAEGLVLGAQYTDELIRTVKQQQLPDTGRHHLDGQRTPAPELCNRIGFLVGWQPLGEKVRYTVFSHDEWRDLWLGHPHL